jgi:signal peptidase I
MAIPYNLEKSKNRWNTKKLLTVLGVGLLFGGGLAGLVRFFFWTPTLIATSAMEPGIPFGSIRYLNKWAQSSDLILGDVILYNWETGVLAGRILGKPGDRIRIDQKTVIRNGEILPNDLYPIEFRDPRPSLPGDLGYRDIMPEIRIPEGHFFVLGDNRDQSMDSRKLGPIPFSRILGKISE